MINLSMLPLSESSWSSKEFDAVLECLKNDSHTMGSKVAQFESEFANFVGSKYAVMVNSGSSANLVAAFALTHLYPIRGKRKVVLVPTLSWSTTYFPWIQAGYRLRFIDIKIHSFNIDLDQLSTALDDDVAGICIPHILGADAGILAIMNLAKRAGVWVCEDTCESLGSIPPNQDSKKLGTFGDVGTFSFFRSHHISTMEGGMMVTDNEDLYHLGISLRAHGWARGLPDESVLGSQSEDLWERKFQFFIPGFNLRPLEMSGAVGITQLQQLDGFLEHRRNNARHLYDGLTSIDREDIKLQEQNEAGSWMAFGIILNPVSLSRERVVRLLENIGVETRPIVTGNFLKQPVMSRISQLCEISGEYPNSDYVHENGIMFANHGRDLRQELDQILTKLNEL
jgi:CDP-6-deoxy-D-xylo-4-hexulose-3-dehydrase